MNNVDEQYEQARKLVQGLKLPLEALILILLEGSGIRVHDVSARIKSKSSVIRKIEHADGSRSIASLTDVLGLRIITYFPDDVDKVATLIEKEFMIDTSNSIDKRAILDPDRFGYLSLHYILQLNAKRSSLPEYEGYKDVKFEVQIRSILQHAWAEIEHDLGYKSETSPPITVRRRFSRLAGLLELADSEFVGIRDQLADSNQSPPRTFMDDVDFHVARLLTQSQPIEFPAWERSEDEASYLRRVAHSDSRFILLDRSLLPISSSNGRFEPCDLLGPGNELIHIGRGGNSHRYSHLFNQALVSTELLLSFPEAREALAVLVNERGAKVARSLDPDWMPTQVVIAVPSQGSTLGIQHIPPFSRITLARISRALESMGVTLNVLGISPDSHPDNRPR